MMFRKPFKVKSNTLIKGSERKKLRSLLAKQFPQLSPEDQNTLVSNKDEMSQVKVLTHSGSSAILYILAGNPVFFECDDTVFPTVYTLWLHPKLLPSFPTWAPVFEKLSGGADLMLPGVVLDEISQDNPLNALVTGQICSVNLIGNNAAVAVGKSAISSGSLFQEDRKGKAVILTHVLGDHLWAMGDKSEPPLIENAIQTESKVEPESNDESASITIDSEVIPKTQELNINENSNAELNCNAESKTEEVVSVLTPEEMDQLLINCLLQSIKTTLKRVEFPLLVSNFHKIHLLANCPSSQTVNVKKSTYKKMSSFLKDMQTKGLLEVKELQKGVESIVSVNFNHPLVLKFRVQKKVIDPENNSAKNVNESKSEYTPPTIKEMYVVSAAVSSLFQLKGIRKGTALSAKEVSTFMKEYVKDNDLQKKDNPSLVVLDPVLAHTILAKSEYAETLLWEELQERCLSKMSPAYEVLFSDNTKTFKKGQLAPIEMKTAQRTGNKKVTLIYNLETYGIDPEKFAHQVQVGVAASTSVTEAPNMKSTQVLIQGNQLKFVGKLLLDEYKIPRKYISGLEKATGGKKK